MLFASWELYFTHSRLLQLTRILNQPGLGGESGLTVQHVNGFLSKISPRATFSGFPPGQTIVSEFIAEAGSVVRTDVMPNWYFTSEGCQARTVLSTADETLDFVDPFVEEIQYKRSAADLYHPYSPEERFAMNNADYIDDIPGSGIIPTPLVEDLNKNRRIFLYTGDWVIVQGHEQLENEC